MPADQGTYYAVVRIRLDDVPATIAAEFFKALNGEPVEAHLGNGVSYAAEIERVWPRGYADDSAGWGE